MAAQGKEKVLRRKSVRGKKVPEARDVTFEQEVVTELEELPPCPQCGRVGIHFCTGKPDDEPHYYVGVKRS